jgi:LytS/YehU family sensor histidine kinase
VLITSLVVWEGLWNLWDANSRFIVVELGLVTQTGSTVSGLWTNTIYMLLAAWYYESADRARRSTAVLREGELGRKGAERWLLQLRLSSLQARLDPRVLFDTLDEAGRLYRSRPAAAEQLLDALIDYLRRALPQLRQAESTLQREVELALAYARILRTPEGRALELEAVVEPTAGEARFPPMVVQPICDALARSALATGEPARLRISAARDGDSARLHVTAEPVQAVPAGECLAEVRRTLQAMFAPLVRMEASCPTAGMASVLVEVPYVAAPRVDR